MNRLAGEVRKRSARVRFRGGGGGRKTDAATARMAARRDGGCASSSIGDGAAVALRRRFVYAGAEFALALTNLVRRDRNILGCGRVVGGGARIGSKHSTVCQKKKRRVRKKGKNRFIRLSGEFKRTLEFVARRDVPRRTGRRRDAVESLRARLESV